MERLNSLTESITHHPNPNSEKKPRKRLIFRKIRNETRFSQFIPKNGLKNGLFSEKISDSRFYS